MKLSLLAALTLLSPVLGYRILAIFPVPSKSHNHMGQGIVGALLKAGHEVTWATPFPKKEAQKGLTYIDVSETQRFIQNVDPLKVQQLNIAEMLEFGRNISVAAAVNKGVQEALMGKYDAVVTEVFFSDLQAGFAAVLQVPWIVLSGTVVHSGVEALVADIGSAALVPAMASDYPLPMTLWQRMANAAMIGMMTAGRFEKLYHEIFDPIAEKKGIVLPPYSKAIYNISILLSNSHPSLAPAISVPPNVVYIAGYHIDDHHSPLPKDLQELMDNSKNGVIYFSMGSVVKGSAFPEQTRKDLIRILGALPCTVLWKFEEPIQGLPKNVHIRAWMPQPAILAHPNLKLFITHGGLLSTLEAIQAGVPLLAVPVFGDQPGNAVRAERAGYALAVPFAPDMGDKLKVALDKMLSDNRYYNKAKELSRLFNNRPLPPSKLIAHYVELAIETKGALHLRSPTYHYAWYERYMLDQLAVVMATIYVAVKLVKYGVNKVLGKSKKEKVKKN
ncbi:UDP-glucosyltransferase 2-like [Leguminivora glycinivorella]|uniref:UDP-glucosyltransferase 2-like n=1 Tax=Leguminivora glycinivorella TaxID=1035111 RepID=UPI00200F430C|nr:UDP-glucosyltransferase 2-like [Leguminivora glycinivorella]